MQKIAQDSEIIRKMEKSTYLATKNRSSKNHIKFNKSSKFLSQNLNSLTGNSNNNCFTNQNHNQKFRIIHDQIFSSIGSSFLKKNEQKILQSG